MEKELSCSISSGDQMADTIIQGCQGLEIYNSHFTSNFGEWALGFCGGIINKDNPCFLPQIEHPLQSLTLLNLSNRAIHNLFSKVRAIHMLSVEQFIHTSAHIVTSNIMINEVWFPRGINL